MCNCRRYRRRPTLREHLQVLLSDPLDDIILLPMRTTDPLCGTVHGLLVGPQESPYAHGLFPFEIQYSFTERLYPACKPKVKIASELVHPELVAGEMQLVELSEEKVRSWELSEVLSALWNSFASPEFENSSGKRDRERESEEEFMKKAKQVTLDSAY